MTRRERKSELRVRDLMTRELVAVGPDLPLRDAVALLDQHHISGAPVVAGGRLVGVFSASDLLGFEVVTPGVPTERPVSDDRAELESVETWTEGDEAPSAFFTDWWADAGAEVVERFRETAQPEWDLLAEHTVADAMSRTVCSVSPDEDLATAAQQMIRAGIHRVLVVDGERPVGILTSMDIVRALADGRLQPA